jgi:septal ring factor EnvC (AmiA/AmiB activator)
MSWEAIIGVALTVLTAVLVPLLVLAFKAGGKLTTIEKQNEGQSKSLSLVERDVGDVKSDLKNLHSDHSELRLQLAVTDQKLDMSLEQLRRHSGQMRAVPQPPPVPKAAPRRPGSYSKIDKEDE